MIEGGYASMRAELAADLISQIKACSPEFFEQLVVDLLVAMGYGGSRADAGHAVGGSGDGGIDGIIKEDRLGLDAVYIQAKRWEGSVGGPVVQAFAGSLMGQKASKGVMITTSHYTKDAQAYVELLDQATRQRLLRGRRGSVALDVSQHREARVPPSEETRPAGMRAGAGG